MLLSIVFLLMVSADNLLTSQVTKIDNSLTVRLLLLLGADPNAADRDGNTSLILAARSGRADAVRQLLEAGADPNARSRQNLNAGDTPLHFLSFHDGKWIGRQHHEVAKLLLANGADVNARNERGNTPLLSAAYYAASNTVWLLLLAGADSEDGTSALHMAAMANDRDKCRTAYLLLAAGAGAYGGKGYNRQNTVSYYREEERLFPIDCHESVLSTGPATVRTTTNRASNAPAVDLNFHDSEGHSLLHIAAMAGNTTLAKRLLDAGADPNAVDNIGLTPLHHAFSGYRDPHVAWLLLDAGADPNVRNSIGQTPLHYAASSLDDDNADLLFRLWQRGARRDVIDNYGNSLLHEAARFGDSEILKLLVLNARGNVNITDINGNTPLHWAAGDNKQDWNALAKVELLLEAGANVNVRNKHGRTPLNGAEYLYRNQDDIPDRIRNLLKQHGAE